MAKAQRDAAGVRGNWGDNAERPPPANAVEKHSVSARRRSRERLVERGSVNEDAVFVLATVFFANSDCHARHYWFCGEQPLRHSS
jgi:hypothetical protein